MNQQVHAAVFRPDDDRTGCAVEFLDSLGATPVPDSTLAIEPTDATPEPGVLVVLTSRTGVELLDEAGWNPGGAVLCCIGPVTADAIRDAGWTVDRVPGEYTSAGLVDHLAPDVDDATVEVARSDHGSVVLTDGLRDAGTDVHETVLYWLVRPEEASESAELVAADDPEAALFISSLTVEHFLDAAAERGTREKAIVGLNDAVVGATGPSTRDTMESHGIDVAVVPDEAMFEALAVAAVETAAPTYHEWRGGKRSGGGGENRDER